MSPKLTRSLAAVIAAMLLGLVNSAVSRATDHCPCPPPYHHCQEGPPCIYFKCACPKPVCDPCQLEHWGYYPTCWRRFPGNLANCPHRSPPWVNVTTDYRPAEHPPVVVPPQQPAPVPHVPAGPESAYDDVPMRPMPVGAEQPARYQGASPQAARPKLSLYTNPQGN